jgi:hypothetical protein
MREVLHMVMLFGSQSKGANLTADAVCGDIACGISKAILFKEDGSGVDGGTPLGTMVEVKEEAATQANEELCIEDNPIEIQATEEIGIPGGDTIVPADVIPSAEPQTDASDVPNGDGGSSADTSVTVETGDTTVEVDVSTESAPAEEVVVDAPAVDEDDTVPAE